MVSGVRFRVSVIRGQRSDDRRQVKNLQNEATFLSSGIRLLTPDTRHLKPVLMKKEIEISDPYFANYLRDATLKFSFTTINPATNDLHEMMTAIPAT